MSVSHVDVALDRDATRADIELDLALKDLALTLPIDANRDERITWGELQAARGPLAEWVARGMSVSSRTGRCPLAIEDLAVRRYDDGAYASLRLRGTCANPIVRLDYALLFDRDPMHRALITVHHGDVATATVASGDARVVAIEPDGSPFVTFLREGVHHILVGYDHLAFLVSLLLPAALLRTKGAWAPAPTLRRSFGNVLGIVTAFTLAHSITLSLAALGWVVPASRWVEAAIAASVLLAAINNLLPIVTRRLWAMGFAFGLVHGFGFAGALSELGLPKGARLVSLFGFNLGVEAGQLFVVGLLLPLLFCLRGAAVYRCRVMPVASIGIAGLACVWLTQRLAMP
jgi:hypothetical protein